MLVKGDTGDPTINQLAHGYHIICGALDRKKEVKVVFIISFNTNICRYNDERSAWRTIPTHWTCQQRVGCITNGTIRGTGSNVLFEELSRVSMETRKNITGCTPSINLYLIYPKYTFAIIYHLMCTTFLSTNFGMPTQFEQSHEGLIFCKSAFPLVVREWSLLPAKSKTIKDYEKRYSNPSR